MSAVEDLESRQANMQERWADRRRHPRTRKLISSEDAERFDITRITNKRRLCRKCKRNTARIHKRTGEVMPCETCRKKKYLTKEVEAVGHE